MLDGETNTWSPIFLIALSCSHCPVSENFLQRGPHYIKKVVMYWHMDIPYTDSNSDSFQFPPIPWSSVAFWNGTIPLLHWTLKERTREAPCRSPVHVILSRQDCWHSQRGNGCLWSGPFHNLKALVVRKFCLWWSLHGSSYNFYSLDIAQS